MAKSRERDTGLKASELRNHLKKMIKEHGDLPIYFDDWNEGYALPGKATDVEFQDGLVAPSGSGKEIGAFVII